MPLALRTSPPVARLNRWSDQTAISAKPSWRLPICSHMANVTWEYLLVDWTESLPRTGRHQPRSEVTSRAVGGVGKILRGTMSARWPVVYPHDGRVAAICLMA